jgi:hypothetical protein
MFLDITLLLLPSSVAAEVVMGCNKVGWVKGCWVEGLKVVKGCWVEGLKVVQMCWVEGVKVAWVEGDVGE